jgi:AcrR family transcriptional regulator
MELKDNTRNKIIHSALTLFSEQGIKKTSVAEVAQYAGLTRITVYRYFEDKEALVFEAFLQVEQIFRDGLEELEQNPRADWETVLSQIGEDLSALPAGDVFARFDEMKRLYPDTYQAIQEVRAAALTGLFEHLFTMAERQDILRPDLNRPVVQALFWELVINIFDKPSLRSFGLSNAELYQEVTNIFLYGIFDSQQA